MAGPLVSVIIPAFNAAATIRRALDSVFAQRTRPAQILVCDDGSTDATGAIAAEYGALVGVPIAYALARDPVRQVRLAVLEHFRESTDDLHIARPLLEEVAETLDPDFTCERCGTLNPASADSCTSCRVFTEKPSKVAIRLLKKIESADGAE